MKDICEVMAQPLSENHEDLWSSKLFWIVAFIALLVRFFYLGLGLPDLWSDAYHNWYISWATIENGWVYSDYKGRELVWLPFYRYLSTAVIYIFSSQIQLLLQDG